MLARYARPQMSELWTEEHKLALWFEIELAAVEGWSSLGLVPPEASDHIREHAVLDVGRVQEIEQITRHDVAAFVQSLEESVGAEHGRWIHYGLTSSDVLDTAFAMQLRDAADLLLAGVESLKSAIELRAREFAKTPKIGRSHGIHAEPTTLGHTFASWYAEMERNAARLKQARAAVAVGKISGAVGTFANVPPAVEAFVCEKLGLAVDPVSTQVISRDRHAEFFTTLALIASSLERFAIEVRHMQRTEVGEAEERFHTGQKGSSAMPHKRNPVLTENVTGLARTVRSYAMAAMENVALWHERDISHSSVERVIGPDATTLLDFALHRMTGVVRDLVVYSDRLRANLDRTRGLPFSQALLLELIKTGESRDGAYRLVQKVAMDAWENDRDFEALVRGDEAISSRVSKETIDACFDLERTLRHVPTILDRVLPQARKAP